MGERKNKDMHSPNQKINQLNYPFEFHFESA